MKALVQRIYASPNFAKIYEWGRLISIIGSAHVVVQAIGFVCGILVIRLLPTQEYAFYTLANTMLGTMTILADGGISSGVMSQGGKVWQDRIKLGVVLATGFRLRKRFAIASILVSAPVLFFLLRHHNASWLMSVLITVSLIPAFIMALSGTLLQIAPLLKQDITPLQKNQIGMNLGRLAMLALTLFAFPWAFVVVLANSLPQIWANLRLRKISNGYADWEQKPDLVVQKNILINVKHILPSSVYYCLSGQITIWLITFFGSTVALAQIGALGRLSMAFNIFGVLFSTLVVPRFARLADNQKFILKRFFLIQLGLVCTCLFIVIIVNVFSENILWVLGNEFRGLSRELVLVAIGSCLTLISISTNRLLSARGVVVPPIVLITWSLSAQVGIAFALQLDELVGVLLYGIYTTAAIYIIRIIYLLFTIVRYETRI